MRKRLTDYDNPWKEALERYFPEFMALFFPKAYADIDWGHKHEFLDKELRQVTGESELGLRRVDQLVRVYRQGGLEIWVLVHVEVQSQTESSFAERMYVYNYRLYDRYHRQVASLAVLADETMSWRPTEFSYNLWDCEIGIRFPAVKLLDYRARWDELEASSNPFAVIVMAHLKSLETRHADDERLAAKIWLMRRLYRRGYQQQDIVNLFRFIDWIMQLPEGLDQIFWQEVQEIEEAEHMPYITSVERIGMQRGIEQGIQQGIQQGMEQGMEQGSRVELLAAIELGLELRFGTSSLTLLPEVRRVQDVELLRTLRTALRTVPTLDAWRQLLLAMVQQESAHTSRTPAHAH
ncbi:MAG: cytosolic protein [Anaerolineae bacterium]